MSEREPVRTPQPVSNPYATAARLEKARALMEVLGPIIAETIKDDNDTTVGEFAAELPKSTWRLAADRAGVKLPSPHTIAIVCTMLEERYSNADPFEHVPNVPSLAGAS